MAITNCALTRQGRRLRLRRQKEAVHQGECRRDRYPVHAGLPWAQQYSEHDKVEGTIASRVLARPVKSPGQTGPGLSHGYDVVTRLLRPFALRESNAFPGLVCVPGETGV
jgi:hypothetical protein